jgi:hypothetical protein
LFTEVNHEGAVDAMHILLCPLDDDVCVFEGEPVVTSS